MSPNKAKDKSLESESIAEKCGHVNAHWTGKDEMTCQLAKGHMGNHEADYTRGDGVASRGAWKDEAGVPVSVYEKDVNAQIVARERAAKARQRLEDATIEAEAAQKGLV